MKKFSFLFTSMLAATLCASAASLGPGTYVFLNSNGANPFTLDAGWAVHGFESGTTIHPFSLNNGPDQQFTVLENGQIQSVGNQALYLADRGGILVLVSGSQNADQFTITSTSNGGYVIQDLTDGGSYVGNGNCGTGVSCNIPLSGNAAVWFVPGGSSPTAAPVPASTPSTITINDTDPSIVYSAGNGSSNWNYFQGGGADYNQDEHSSNFQRCCGPFQGASVAVTFRGTGITWIGKKGPNYGMASISVDGGAAQTFDAYNPTEIDQQNNFSVSLPFGTHVLRISLLAAKNGAASDYNQTIDAFQINGSILPSSNATIAGYNSSQLRYNGSWTCGGNNPGDLSSGHCWSNTANSSTSWTFTGSLVQIFGRPDLENGSFTVSIDGNYITTVDMQFGNVDDDELNSALLFAGQVSSGQHTIELVATGTHDGNASNSFVQIDEFRSYQ